MFSWSQLFFCGLRKPIQENKKMYDPYLHATNSSILPLLAHTEMQVLSPIEMLRKFQLAPLDGEIDPEKYASVLYEGKVTFGRLQSSRYYNLDVMTTLFSEHTKNYIPTSPLPKKLYQSAFSQINLLLIDIARKKETGQWNDKDEKQLNSTKLFAEMNATIQIFYLILLLNDYIQPNEQLLDSLEATQLINIYNAILEELTFEKLLTTIIINKMNIADIYQNPTSLALQSIEELLILPRYFLDKNDHLIPIKERRIFIASSQQNINTYDRYTPSYFSQCFTKNLEGYGINYLLYAYAKKSVTDNFFKELKPLILTYIEALEDKMKILKSIIEKDYSKQYFKFRKHFPFPIILICHDNEKMMLTDSYQGEYSAKVALKLGQDIQMLATNTEVNRSKLLEYLAEQNLTGINVVLINDLKNSIKTNIEPVFCANNTGKSRSCIMI